MIKERAIKSFCGGRATLVVPVGPTLFTVATLQLACTVKSVVSSVFNDHAARICSSPEKHECRLSQEEALGHLIGSLLVGELLPEEARPIGKRLDFHATKEKKAQEKEKESARQKKKGLKRRKLSAEELSTALDAVDADTAAERAVRLARSLAEELQLPDKRSTIVERRAPKVDPFACRIRTLEQMFGSQEACDAIDAAECVECNERELFYDFDCDDNPIDHDRTREDIELALAQYRHALSRLKAAFPEVLNDCSADGTCEHRRRCPCGGGMRGAWPWVIQTPRRGYCERSKQRRSECNDQDGEWSCEELHEERQRWLWALSWSGSPDSAEARAYCMPNGECRMPEERFRAEYEALRRELYWSWRELGLE